MRAVVGIRHAEADFDADLWQIQTGGQRQAQTQFHVHEQVTAQR